MQLTRFSAFLSLMTLAMVLAPRSSAAFSWKRDDGSGSVDNSHSGLASMASPTTLPSSIPMTDSGTDVASKDGGVGQEMAPLLTASTHVPSSNSTTMMDSSDSSAVPPPASAATAATDNGPLQANTTSSSQSPLDQKPASPQQQQPPKTTIEDAADSILGADGSFNATAFGELIRLFVSHLLEGQEQGNLETPPKGSDKNQTEAVPQQQPPQQNNVAGESAQQQEQQTQQQQQQQQTQAQAGDTATQRGQMGKRGFPLRRVQPPSGSTPVVLRIYSRRPLPVSFKVELPPPGDRPILKQVSEVRD